jgi:hypothetical protein
MHLNRQPTETRWVGEFAMGRILTIPVLAIFLPGLLIGQSASGAELITPPASDQAPQQPAAAQPAAVSDIRPSGQPIVLQVSLGTLLRLPTASKTVFVADPAVADVLVQQGQADYIYVFGKSAGATSLYAVDDKGNILLNKLIRVDGPVPVMIIRKSDISFGGQPTPAPTTVIQSESTSTRTGLTTHTTESSSH